MKKLFFVLTMVFSVVCYSQKDTVFIKNVNDYVEGKVNVLVSPSGRKSVVTIEEDTALGPEGVNPYIETLIFDNSVIILCLKEYRVGKKILVDTLAVDYYRKSVFLNPRNYDPIITKEDREFQKLITRKLKEKD